MRVSTVLSSKAYRSRSRNGAHNSCASKATSRSVVLSCVCAPSAGTPSHHNLSPSSATRDPCACWNTDLLATTSLRPSVAAYRPCATGCKTGPGRGRPVAKPVPVVESSIVATIFCVQGSQTTVEVASPQPKNYQPMSDGFTRGRKGQHVDYLAQPRARSVRPDCRTTECGSPARPRAYFRSPESPIGASFGPSPNTSRMGRRLAASFSACGPWCTSRKSRLNSSSSP